MSRQRNNKENPRQTSFNFKTPQEGINFTGNRKVRGAKVSQHNSLTSIKIPIVGKIVADKKLGNKITWFN